MKKLEESRILAMAPNASAISNAKKLCDKGAFLKLWRSVDDTLYMGECKGSGKSNYTVSVDFIDEENPVTRCTCPSRQFPCKHGLALLFEILRGKKFEECEIPEDILAKREKKGKLKAKRANEEKEVDKENKFAIIESWTFCNGECFNYRVSRYCKTIGRLLFARTTSFVSKITFGNSGV